MAPSGLRAAAHNLPAQVGTARRGADSGGTAACKASEQSERGGSHLIFAPAPKPVARFTFFLVSETMLSNCSRIFSPTDSLV